MKKVIAFICNGNIQRSVIAAESLKRVLRELHIDSGFSVVSFGLQGTGGTNPPKHTYLSKYPKEWMAAKPTLERLDIDIRRHRFQKISERAMKKAHVIIAMDNKTYSRAKNSLIKQFPNYKEKIHRFSKLTAHHTEIIDPSGSGSERLHKKVIEIIYSTVTKKYKEILKWVS
ncbi:MAG TPA: hypothetical protein VJH94_01900 [Candidatus Paceibacterota bacterium]